VKNINFLLGIIPLLFIGCASEPNSFGSFRASEFDTSNLVVSDKGLSREMIDAFLSTQFPPANNVSIAVLSLFNANDNEFSYYVLNQENDVNHVERIVPIARIFIPRNITFFSLYELGLRSICEYTIILYNTTSRPMTFSQWMRGEYKFESNIEFSLIDNRTTAVIASDRLYSSVIKKRRSISNADIEEAKNELFTLQANLLIEKLNLLFNRN
jgi:hypothetical protein